jgi:sugar phosphate permease
MSAIVVKSVQPTQVGVASGMNANIRTIGGALGSSVASSILASGVSAAHPIPKESGYTHVFWLLTVAAVLAALAALIVPAARQATQGSVAMVADETAGGTGGADDADDARAAAV